MSHADSSAEKQCGGIRVCIPGSEEEFQNLLEAFSTLLKIDQRTNSSWKSDAQGDSNSNSVVSTK